MEELIGRDGKVPIFIQYILQYCIVDPDKDPPIIRKDYPEELQNLARVSVPNRSPGPQDIVIPNWQRRIVWGEENLIELLETKSQMYGTIILAKGVSSTESWKLIDGLQRLSVGTAVVHCLWEFVLSPSPSMPIQKDRYKQLQNEIGSRYPIVQWNHKRLMEHSRNAISDSYKNFYREVSGYIKKQIEDVNNNEKFKNNILDAFLMRQVAIDPYHGFTEEHDLINTFLGINRTGEVLSQLDLLRSSIISQMEHLKIEKFPQSYIFEFENRFTEIFQSEKSNKFFKSLGTQLYNIMYENTAIINHISDEKVTMLGSKPEYIFKNWDTVDKHDFDDLLEYIDAIWEIANKKIKKNEAKWKFPYIAQMKNFSLPFCMFAWFYYRNHYTKFLKIKQRFVLMEALENKAKILKITVDELQNKINKNELKLDKELEETHERFNKMIEKRDDYKSKLKEAKEEKNVQEIEKYNQKIKELFLDEPKYQDLFKDLPDFLGGDLITLKEQWSFYRAMTRKVLDGDIGKTERILHAVMRGEIDTMEILCKKLSPESAGDLNDAPDPGWLRAILLSARYSSKKPQLIFNACLLPKRGLLLSAESVQPEFDPLNFGSKKSDYQIDHLIPNQSSHTMENERGYEQINNLVNLAPLNTVKNGTRGNDSCSSTLASNNIYNEMRQRHPYCKWLIDEHYKDHIKDPDVFRVTGTEDPLPPEKTDRTMCKPLDTQLNLIEGQKYKICEDRINKLQELLNDKL